MWVLTTCGFFSVVESREDRSVLQVRGRCRADLEAFRERYLGDAAREIFELPGRDYEYRIYAGHDEVASAMAAATRDIDYGNFKDAVKERQGAKRAGVYSRVWGDLVGVSDKRERW
jgi:hypothetical protein